MNILIVEDEDLAVKKLKKTLSCIDETDTVIRETDSIQVTVEWLQQNPSPDLILMDIELADGQSFEIFNHTEVKSPVIFVTSYDEFALKAFKVNSIDYLLKPVQKEDLSAALDKYRQMKQLYKATEKTQPAAPTFNLEDLVKELQQKLQVKEYRKRFLVKHAQKLVSIDIEEIAYFFSDGRLNFFKTFDNLKFVVDYTMDELDDMLDPDKFFRISRSFLISLSSLNEIHVYLDNRLLRHYKHDIE